MSRKLRVIQWTTGNIGSRALRGILARDDMSALLAARSDARSCNPADAPGLEENLRKLAIPSVVAAEPGIVSYPDLPLVTGPVLG